MVGKLVKMAEKRKIPKFRRQDSHKKKKLGNKWRSARGLQSKVRLSKKGYLKKPKVGYRNKKNQRGKRDGLLAYPVFNLNDLEKVPKNHGIIVRKIGLKNKLEIIKKALSLKLEIINIKNPEQFVKKTEQKIKDKKAVKQKKEKDKEKKKKEAEEKAKEKEDSQKKSEKDEESTKKQKEEQKKEKEKILTKKDQ
jgi:large subunit ribosomal protein L32e